MWKYLTPQLPVLDVRATQEYYRDVLGFRIAWLWKNDYGAVQKGDTQIYLTRVDEPEPPVCCCVDVEDADAAYEVCRSKGANIVSEIETKPWGMREFTLQDPDGHLFRIGHGVKRVDGIESFTTEP